MFCFLPLVLKTVNMTIIIANKHYFAQLVPNVAVKGHLCQLVHNTPKDAAAVPGFRLSMSQLE